jgi:hypothetical protein
VRKIRISAAGIFRVFGVYWEFFEYEGGDFLTPKEWGTRGEHFEGKIGRFGGDLVYENGQSLNKPFPCATDFFL